MNIPNVVRGSLLSGLTLALLFACSGGSDRKEFVSEAPEAGADGGGQFVADAALPMNVLPSSQPDPKTCAEAVALRSYVGCDYWPTQTSNVVADVFDFAVAVANNGADAANVTLTGYGMNKQVTVAPGSLEKIYLPWIPELKGPAGQGLDRSVLVRAGAFHLVSDKPVVVYQFSPLEFKAVGGESGKDWSACKPEQGATECYSYSNDASLLLPSTAMTGAYRVMGDYGFSSHPFNDSTNTFDTTKPLEAIGATAMTITATVDNTHIEITLGAKANVIGSDGDADGGVEGGVADAGDEAGADAGAEGGIPVVLGVIPQTNAGGLFTLVLNAGDVAQIVADKGQSFDLSGSVVRADKPVQLITSIPCQFHPLDTFACDHEEETVFPVETLGKHYVVTSPTGPSGPGFAPVPHSVRIYGNSDGTNLTYKPSAPSGCPSVVNAGEVADCPQITDSFEVIGDKAFGVGLFMLGGAVVDPTGSASGAPQGDPSQSFAVGVEQYRQSYVFLAPTDYKTSYVDVIAGPDTKITIDNADATAKLTPITGTTFFLARAPLPAINGGVHTLTATRPVGIQVVGYGDNTSFQYPGGLNLVELNPAPK